MPEADRARAERAYVYDATPIDRALHKAHAGLALIGMIQAGAIPGSPMWQTAGCRIAQAFEGMVVFEAEAAAWVLNFGGSAHGGWTATLLDSAMGFAILSTLPKGRVHTTAELSIRYVRPLVPSVGALRVEARVVHAGRRMATAEGRVIDAGGRIYAHGATSCLIIDLD